MSRTATEVALLSFRIARIETARTVRAVGRRLRWAGRFRAASPERLLIAPQDIRTADPTIAGDIYAGHLVFGGRLVDAHGQSPFDVAAPTEAWAEALHSFGWLRHLRAADSALSRVNARALVEDWITHCSPGRAAVGWRPPVVTRRLLSWLAQSPLILTPPDASFYRKFMKSIGRQTGFLQKAVLNGLAGSERLFAGVALAEAGLCAEGLASARKFGSRTLTEELRRQILPDGGHVSRDPSILVELLLDLLPLRQAYAARSAPVPPALLNAIDRIIPMIRLFRHRDGSLALFNGMGVSEPDVLATVLTYDDAQAQPLSNAPHSGYRRLEAADALLICDVGLPPPPEFSERAHAGTLSFEFSVGSQRIVVNCGRPNTANPAANEAARSTAAHSTLVFDDTSSSSFADPKLSRWFGQQIVAGPKHVVVNREASIEAPGIETSHDGYARRYGVIHKRKLTLAQGGGGLYGRDEIVAAPGRRVPPAATPFVIRFHLHPSVTAEAAPHGKAIMLNLADKERWMFEAGGEETLIEESIFFAVAEGPRRSEQIVVSGIHPEKTSVDWSFTRLPS